MYLCISISLQLVIVCSIFGTYPANMLFSVCTQMKWIHAMREYK